MLSLGDYSPGGAVHSEGDVSMLAVDCRFHACTASQGGAIALRNFTALRCSFDSCSAQYSGGAISAEMVDLSGTASTAGAGSADLVKAQNCSLTDCSALTGNGAPSLLTLC